MAEKPKGRDMQLKIVACRQVYSGVNKRGDSYTIYEVDAERPADGMRINQKLRSFTALPIGQTVEVTVVPFRSEQWGPSFTLYPKNARGSGSSAQLNELREQVDELFDRLRRLTERVGELEGGGGKSSAEDAPSGDRQQAAVHFGEDPPW